MARHPLDEGLDSGLEQIKDGLQSQTALDTRVEVGEVVADGGDTSATVTIDGSGETDEYVATVFVGPGEFEFRSSDADEVLESILRKVAPSDGGESEEGLETRDPARLEVGEHIRWESNLGEIREGEVVEKRETYNVDLEGYVTGAIVEADDMSIVRYDGHEARTSGEVTYHERIVRDESEEEE